MGHYLVYWMSDFNGEASVYSEQSKPNVMHFAEGDELAKALKFQTRLQKLCEAKGTYRGRIVTHVSEVQFPKVQKPLITNAVKDYNESMENGANIAKKYTLKTIVGKFAHIFARPISVWNPDKWFPIVDAKMIDGGMFIRGENTSWYSINICEVRETT